MFSDARLHVLDSSDPIGTCLPAPEAVERVHDLAVTMGDAAPLAVDFWVRLSACDCGRRPYRPGQLHRWFRRLAPR